MTYRRPEDIYDAINQMIDTNPAGKKDKVLAAELWPDLTIEKAQSKFSQKKNPLSDLFFHPTELHRLMRACGNPEVLINWLCEEFGYEAPKRKIVMSPEAENRILRSVLRERGIEVDVGAYVEQHREVITSLQLESARPRHEGVTIRKPLPWLKKFALWVFPKATCGRRKR